MQQIYPGWYFSQYPAIGILKQECIDEKDADIFKKMRGRLV
jgi:hypothetical protein